MDMLFPPEKKSMMLKVTTNISPLSVEDWKWKHIEHDSTKYQFVIDIWGEKYTSTWHFALLYNEFQTQVSLLQPHYPLGQWFTILRSLKSIRDGFLCCIFHLLSDWFSWTYACNKYSGHISPCLESFNI